MKVVIAATDYERKNRTAWLDLLDLSRKHRVPIADAITGEILYDPENGSVAPSVGSAVNAGARSRSKEK
jgi:hypothetical protein